VIGEVSGGKELFDLPEGERFLREIMIDFALAKLPSSSTAVELCSHPLSADLGNSFKLSQNPSLSETSGFLEGGSYIRHREEEGHYSIALLQQGILSGDGIVIFLLPMPYI
jgi:hypothetical protein